VCERKDRIRDSGVKRGRREAGNGERESERERSRNSGSLTFYKTAVLSQVLVLSKSFFLFFCTRHYLVPRGRQQDAASRKPAAKRACDPDEDAADCTLNLAPPRAPIPGDVKTALREELAPLMERRRGRRWNEHNLR